jgi:hypothetical protein
MVARHSNKPIPIGTLNTIIEGTHPVKQATPAVL